MQAIVRAFRDDPADGGVDPAKEAPSTTGESIENSGATAACPEFSSVTGADSRSEGRY
jgi:hypothetical protein